MTTTKVFVGNLSFKTTEEMLAKEFGVAGKVVSANIISRGPRSLGYGFVELESEAVAKKAVELLDKKEVDGRPINVEVAKPRADEDKPNDEDTEGGRRGGRGRGRGGFRSRGGNFRSRGGNFRGAPRGSGFRGIPRGGGGFRGRGRGGRGRGFGNVNDDERPRPERVSSSTTLFVANLPYDLTDETFAEKIKEFVPKFKKAYIVVKPNGRSKGFGFVEFDDEDSQQKALEQLNEKEIAGRSISVKIALTDAKDSENGEDK